MNRIKKGAMVRLAGRDAATRSGQIGMVTWVKQDIVQVRWPDGERKLEIKPDLYALTAEEKRANARTD
jgi:hypothetical protein